MALDLSIVLHVVIRKLRSNQPAAKSLVMALLMVVFHRLRDDVSEVCLAEEDVLAQRLARCPDKAFRMGVGISS